FAFRNCFSFSLSISSPSYTSIIIPGNGIPIKQRILTLRRARDKKRPYSKKEMPRGISFGFNS
ncbi:MAG: hypothetical protein IJ042_03515, partial [Butyricicoccus sp.]|nr:hypothetical protein [Butyricicoccus sp.]